MILLKFHVINREWLVDQIKECAVAYAMDDRTHKEDPFDELRKALSMLPEDRKEAMVWLQFHLDLNDMSIPDFTEIFKHITYKEDGHD